MVGRNLGRDWITGLQRGSGTILDMRERVRGKGKENIRMCVCGLCELNHIWQTLRGTVKDGNCFGWHFGCYVCLQE